MNLTNCNFFSAFTSAKLSGGAAIVAALAGTITLGSVAAARADVPVTAQPTQGAPAVHRMVMTPVWVAKPGSGPVVGGIVAHMTTRHATQSKSKMSAADVIDEPIWPVTPPAPDPTDPSGSGSGSGNGSGG